MIHYKVPKAAQRPSGIYDRSLCRGPGHNSTNLNAVDCPACLRAVGTPEYIRAQKLNGR